MKRESLTRQAYLLIYLRDTRSKTPPYPDEKYHIQATLLAGQSMREGWGT